MKTQLFANAGGPPEFPGDDLPEVAVMGRSNVGKSSFINALVGRRQLARTSGTPGKTRRIHFYRLEDALYLVDLPGYGYAAVSKSEQATWRPMVESYLTRTRRPLRGALLLIDVRRGPKQEERDLLDWLAREEIPARIVLTKRDKLKRNALEKQVRIIRGTLGIDGVELQAVSSTQGAGFGQVAAWIEDWTHFAITRPDGAPLARS